LRKLRHIVTFLNVGVREPNKIGCMILLSLRFAMANFHAIVNLVFIDGSGG